MVLCEIYKFGGRRGGAIGKDLVVDMLAKVLDTDFIEPWI
jgi:hypothetical protein